MRYLMMIYGDEKAWETMSEEEGAQEMKGYHAYTEWLQEKGWFLGGEPLQPTPTAKTVRVRDGERLVSDGPFAETKEQLGGYYLIDVPGEGDALEAAERLPGSRLGSIEVRPIMEVPADPSREG
jgi:hypothetical protein